MNHPLDEAVSRIYSSHRGGSSANPVAALVVTGDLEAAEFMRFALAKRCALVELVTTARQAEQLLSRCRFDVLIADNSLPAARTWISSWRAQGHNLPVILLTEQKMPLPPAGVEALIKPFALEQLLTVVDRALSSSSAPEAEVTLPLLDDEPPPGHLANIICHSEAMQNILATIQVVASRNTTVLLQGESGSGKEIAAQCLHHFSGRRGAFVPVNCSAISPELVESELFGHTRGAFTGAAQARQGLFSYAEGGTLFLDEIG
ncbi:MAG TPA: sigma 54-interacting transcriptional regulator, partial [Gammaproteobacteria bacterium]|nr:sigma 54-interacting transcriptional regulator [Gammaproteobacteria bacterium]